MKRVFVFLSIMLLVLSCDKMADVKTVDLAKLSADYEAKDGETLTGILGGKEGPVSESPFVYKP